jgi:ribA/ribD-fused uncharacterized protein
MPYEFNEVIHKLLAANRVTDETIEFYGGPLSSFALIRFKDGDHVYDSREHYFQSQKTLNVTDQRHVIQAKNPGLAKLYGRHVTLRSDWETIKFEVMVNGIRLQAEQDDRFRQMLLATGQRKICEDSPSDGIWGCREIERGRAAGPGLNLLGKALMQVRDEMIGAVPT